MDRMYIKDTDSYGRAGMSPLSVMRIHCHTYHGNQAIWNDVTYQIPCHTNFRVRLLFLCFLLARLIELSSVAEFVFASEFVVVAVVVVVLLFIFRSFDQA